MYRTIIAGCNGRERGRGAVSLAHAISSATGARLLLVGVHHHPPLPFPGSYAGQRGALEHDLRVLRDGSPRSARPRRGGPFARARAAPRRGRGARRPDRRRLAPPPGPAKDRRGRSGHAGAPRSTVRGRGRTRSLGAADRASPHRCRDRRHARVGARAAAGARARASHRRAPVVARGGRRDRPRMGGPLGHAVLRGRIAGAHRGAARCDAGAPRSRACRRARA